MKEWEEFLSNLANEIGAPVVERWLRPLTTLRFDAANLYLEAQNPMQIAWFEEHIRPRLKQTFVNGNYRPIKVHIVKQAPQAASPAPVPTKPPAFISDAIDPSLTLEHFSVTKGNQMVYKLLTEWITTGVSTFNPIFIYGPPGCGKTHLLTATALAFQKRKKRLLYVSADTFTEHVVQAIRMGQMQAFRAVYREIDLLLIDNVDRLANRTASQEEFFHTFNTLHLQNKPIILTSTVPPSKLTNIEFRLISRFEWGLPVGMDCIPIAQTLQLKADLWKFALSAELSKFLLEQFPTDPLKALQTLTLRAKVSHITPNIAKTLLADLLKKEQTHSLTPEKILKALSAHFGITADDILGKSQAREFAFPRQIAMYLYREKLKLPYQGIGKLFGRDHSTVMSSIKQIEQKIENKETLTLEAILGVV